MVDSAFNHIAYNRATVAAVIAVSYMYAVASHVLRLRGQAYLFVYLLIAQVRLIHA